MNTLFHLSYEMDLYGEATEIVRNFTLEGFTRAFYVLLEQNIKTGAPVFSHKYTRILYTQNTKM